jgi:hypothetical protein
MRTTSLPFELDSDEIRTHHVSARAIHGAVSLEGDFLIIDFFLEGAPADAAPHTTRIDLADIERVSMTGGSIKSPRLLIDAAADDVLDALPWADGCLCVMRFRRAHGQRLRELIEEIEVRMAEIRTREDR